MSDERRLRIEVPVLVRVEGEGALSLWIDGERIERLQLRIFEPPRFFEQFLRGRDAQEVLDAVARICGICPVAYQMSALQAMEAVAGVRPTPWISAMRRLMYCGEWLQSHSLHIHLLAAPDYLGFDSAMAMAEHYPEEVRRGLRLQGLGNRLIALFGGRSVHPVGVRPGGFFRPPHFGDDLLEQLQQALADAEALVRWTAALPLPDDEQDFISVALYNGETYPMNHGRLVSDRGLDVDPAGFEQVVEEIQVPHSTAFHALIHGQPYLVGPLARLNLNHHLLPPPVRDLLRELPLRFPSRNMFHSIVARAVEVYFALWEAHRLLRDYQPPQQTWVACQPRDGVGYGCTEAPRGILWHRYRFDGEGKVAEARIIPPTSQNQARMEQDLRLALQRFGLKKDPQQLRLHAEKVIRNYDPCISCATHFLELNVFR